MPWTRGSLLGEGGYGRVFECLDDDGRICAAKVVALRPGDDERARVAQAEIEREVEMMKRLSHPNIVRYIGTERDAKELIIFLELVPGGSISSMLGKYGKFKESVVRGYCREILQGLDYLHSNKILHRDIKGQNILVDFAGVCKLSDFGCSKELYGEIASTMTLRGTPQFMAPEVLRNHGKGYTEKADIWSVGCTVIEMCTARRPWPEFNTNEAVMYHVAMRDSCPKTPEWVSEDCKAFCALCFARDPIHRPTVSELLRHALVQDAALKNKQRLGTNAADPAEISLELRSHRNDGTTGEEAAVPRPTDDAHAAASNPLNPFMSPGPAGSAGVGEGKTGSHLRPSNGTNGERLAESRVPAPGEDGGGGGRRMQNTAEEPASIVQRPAHKGRRGGPMGGVVLREDFDEDEDDEDSFSSDDGDEDGGRTPGGDTLHVYAHKGWGGGAAVLAPAHGQEGGGEWEESLVQDVKSVLQVVEQAHQLVQSVTSNRQKCFCLAQRMRRARIPLEKLLEGRRAGGGDGGGDDQVRHAIMDTRDCLENSLELMRRHGQRGVARLWVWIFKRDTAAEFRVQEDEIARVLSVLHEHCSKKTAVAAPTAAAAAGAGGGQRAEEVLTGRYKGGVCGAAALPDSAMWDPPLWSRRILRGDRSEMRSMVLDVQRRLWCGTRALRIYQADARKLVQTCRANFGLVRAILEVPAGGERASPGDAEEGERSIWTAHSDGRVRIWDPQQIVQVDEIDLAASGPSRRSAVMCLLYYARQDGRGEVWAGTAAGRIFVISARRVAGDGSLQAHDSVGAAGWEGREYRVEELVRDKLNHQGSIRCMLRVGDEVWTGSYSGEIFAWGATRSAPYAEGAGAMEQTEQTEERTHVTARSGGIGDRMLQRGHGAVKAMTHMHSDLVLTGHRSGLVQIWTAEGLRQAFAVGGASVKCAVEAGGLVWTGHADGNFRLWSLLGDGDRLELFRVVKAHKTAILAMVRDAESVWSCTKNGTLRQWSIALLLEDPPSSPLLLHGRAPLASAPHNRKSLADALSNVSHKTAAPLAHAGASPAGAGAGFVGGGTSDLSDPRGRVGLGEAEGLVTEGRLVRRHEHGHQDDLRSHVPVSMRHAELLASVSETFSFPAGHKAIESLTLRVLPREDLGEGVVSGLQGEICSAATSCNRAGAGVGGEAGGLGSAETQPGVSGKVGGQGAWGRFRTRHVSNKTTCSQM